MASKLDLVLAVGLYPGLNTSGLARKMGQKQPGYASAYKMLQKLKAESVIKTEKERFLLAETASAQKLFRLIYFCFANNADYNRIVSGKTAEFVKTGFEKGIIEGLPFDSKTVKRIANTLSRNGFAVVESRKPFACRIVYSEFLEELVTFFFGKTDVNCRELTECVDENRVNTRLEKAFSIYRKRSRE
ncbi:MAG: hypothetical protein HY917_01920, partial [Candidatus Diapherotrites archaeon]|nr:hypothetical protein [Candidatus Diapherotrites archaeon]